MEMTTVFEKGSISERLASTSSRLKRPWRSFGLFQWAFFVLCLALLLRAFLLDPYQVPTGSMAPTLLGNHRACACPRCGFLVQVGLHERDSGDRKSTRLNSSH